MISKKGQISVEMLLLIVVIVAIVLVVANQLIQNAKKASQKAQNTTDEILAKVDQVAKGDVGDYCNNDDDCKSNLCIDNECQ